MVCNEFKGGIGTSSRKVESKIGTYTVGVLVQCNYGSRKNLRIAGVPVRQRNSGRSRVCFHVLHRIRPRLHHRGRRHRRAARRASAQAPRAPRLPWSRRDGSISGNGSGDIFIAFSTANSGAAAANHVVDLKMLPNDQIEPVFAATVQATEEAVINAMVAAETMTGIENHKSSPSARKTPRRPQEIQPAESMSFAE